MSSEREILAASLPPEEGSAAAELEKGLPRKGPDCPLTTDLIRLARGLVAGEPAARLHRHLEGCSLCRDRALGFRQVADQAGPSVPEDAVQRVASLFTSGAGPEQMVQETGLTAEAVLAALCEARRRGLLGGGSSRKATVRSAAEAGRAQRGTPGLLELLQARSRYLRRLTVFPSSIPPDLVEGKEEVDERIRAFGCHAAPFLVELLSQASYAGIGWGRMVASAVEGTKRVCERPPERARGPLVCVATVGGLVGERRVRPESSSSLLATQMAEAFNGDWKHLYTLHGVEAFIASYLGTPDEIDLIRKRIHCFPNYRAIFGGPGQLGRIDQLDAIVTSCGNAHHYSQFWTTELPRLGVSAEKLNTLAHGNIGGVLLEREDLGSGDKSLFDDIARRWTGITLRHHKQCVQRNPGVILLALRHNKADVVFKCVELDLVTQLVIDEDLALALWDRVDPHRRHPRLLDVVRPGQAAPQGTP
jgi:DNA-binding transcriptional regulator LsrR (DeoR family)